MKSPILTLCLLLPHLAAAQDPSGQENQAREEQTPPGEAPLPEIIRAPRLVGFREAEYPEAAVDEGVEAEVTFEIDIDAAGKVEAAVVTVPAQPPGYGFDEAAQRAVEQFEFEPAETRDGPVPVRVTYEYEFTLAAPEPPTDEPPGPDPVVNFRGVLVERGTRDPLPGLLVTVFKGRGEEAAGFEAISKADGSFELYDLAPGTWKVLVEAEGYFPLRTSEEIAAGELTEATYYVERGAYNPFDILVEAKRPRKEVNRTTIVAEEVEKIPGGFGDVLSVVQNLPSVARVPVGGDIVVRGAAPEDTQTLVAGVTVPRIYHLGGLRTVIPTGMLESVDFYPGNFTTAYGRATGGILDIGLKRLKPDNLGGYLDVCLMDASLFLEAPVGGNGAIAVGARRNYIDVVLDAVVPDSAPVSLTAAPRYWDTELLARYHVADGHDVQAFFITSDDRFEILFENPGEVDIGFTEDFGTTSRFYRGIVEYDLVPGPAFSNALKLAVGRDREHWNFGEDVFFDSEADLAQIRDTVRWSLTGAMRLIAGFDAAYRVANLSVSLPTPPKEGQPDAGGPPDFADLRTFEENDIAYTSLGAFAEVELSLVEHLLVTPGVRFDHFDRIGESTVAPRLSTRYDIADTWTVKGGAGLFYQEPPEDETNEVFGNPELKSESAVHYSAGIEFRPTDYLSFDVTGFYKDLSDVVTPSDGVVERDGETMLENYTNDGVGRVYGAEVLIRHAFAHNFFGWLSYAVSRAERRDAADEDYRLFDFDQTHILTVLGTYRLPRNWEVGFRLRLVSGNPKTPVAGAVFNSDTDEYQPIFGRVNTERMPAFNQLDLRVDKRWIYDAWILNAYLDIQNVYDHQNTEGIGYNYDYTREIEQHGLPILTVVGLRAEF